MLNLECIPEHWEVDYIIPEVCHGSHEVHTFDREECARNIFLAYLNTLKYKVKGRLVTIGNVDGGSGTIMCNGYHVGIHHVDEHYIQRDLDSGVVFCPFVTHIVDYPDVIAGIV